MSGHPVEPPFDELGAELRGRVGDAFREEAEEDERAAHQARLRRRTLADVFADHRGRGDVVAVTVGGRTFTGPVVYALGDLARIALADGVVDVSLGAPMTTRVVAAATGEGVGPGEGATSFRSRLLELELEGARIEIGGTGGRGVSGRLAAVARDHLLLDTADGEVVVHLATVEYVITRHT